MSDNPMVNLTKQLQSDEDYAWGWYCNLLMSVVDAGGNREIAKEASRRFMKLAFDIDIKDND